MSINLVVQDGVVKSPALRYATDGKAEYRFTLEQREGDFTLWLPCCAVGSAAERLAEALEDGMAIVLTSAKLCYRKRTTKAGEVSRLEVLVWSVDVLSTTPQEKTSGEGEYAGDHDAGAVLTEASGPVKKGKPRYPKWRPEQQN